MTTENPLGLRKFQRDAVDHLSPEPGRLIADDPGLGKTFMAGELDRLVRLETPDALTLVIAPKALLYTWGEWYSTHLPDVRVSVMNPKDAVTRTEWALGLLERNASVYIVHYEGLKKELEEISKVDWTHVIVDEAHRIGNPKSAVSKAVRVLNSEYRTALTGTPADRMIDQIWPILNFIDPERWASFWRFQQRYVEDVYDYSSGSVRLKKQANPSMMPELRQRLEPIMIRRRKAEVLTELPAKEYKNVWVDLSPKQRRVYNEMRDVMVAWVGEHEDQPLQAAVVIAQLIRLQQIALATPKLVPVKRMVHQYWTDEIGLELRDRQGRRISEGLSKVEIDAIDIELEDPSSKLDAAMDIIKDLVGQGQKVVVFSQFSRAIDLLINRLETAGIYAGKFTGATPQPVRDQIVQEFAEGELMVFAGTIGAGGTGLNLQSASTIIFLDRAWKPGDNLQAEDRIHRIGQLAEHVVIIDIMARDTIDLGRHQHIRLNWHNVQVMLGDKHFDWTHSIEEEESLYQENP